MMAREPEARGVGKKTTRAGTNEIVAPTFDPSPAAV
jgi:hypothetical protein